jgi:hypothetical protein
MQKETRMPVVVWAVDPHDQDGMPSHSSLEALRNYRVIPVAILENDKETNFEQLKSYLNSCNVSRLEPPIILKGHPKKSDWPDQLHAFALEHQAELIALTTHGRTGIARLFLGSFAERLLDRSYIPILFLSKEELSLSTSHRAIFATDFTIQSKKAFQTFLKFAKHSINEVIIYHANPIPLQTMAAAEIAGVPDLYPENHNGEDAATAHLWRDELSATEPGIHLQGMINGNCTSIARGILETCAKDKIGVIGITAEKSLLEKSIFGSVAEELFRHQTGLVWVSNSRINEIR